MRGRRRALGRVPCRHASLPWREHTPHCLDVREGLHWQRLGPYALAQAAGCRRPPRPGRHRGAWQGPGRKGRLRHRWGVRDHAPGAERRVDRHLRKRAGERRGPHCAHSKKVDRLDGGGPDARTRRRALAPRKTTRDPRTRRERAPERTGEPGPSDCQAPDRAIIATGREPRMPGQSGRGRVPEPQRGSACLRATAPRVARRTR